MSGRYVRFEKKKKDIVLTTGERNSLNDLVNEVFTTFSIYLRIVFNLYSCNAVQL